MRDLLKRWAELEPERCRPIYSGATSETVEILQPDDSYWCTVTVSDDGDAHTGVQVDSYIQILIQGLVQGAIEKHCWHYEQRWYGTIKVALVYPHGISRLIRHEADTHAEAILRTYIEALLVTRQNQYSEVTS